MENTLDFNEPASGAHFSECRNYRFCLSRIWDTRKPYVMFIGLNPSTANEKENDPTIRRVIGFAKKWGYGGVYMMNCFPFISTDPKGLHQGQTELNFDWLTCVSLSCKDVVFAWGNFSVVKDTGTDRKLSQMFPNAKALVINKDGSPRHPLYVPLSTELINFSK